MSEEKTIEKMENENRDWFENTCSCHVVNVKRSNHRENRQGDGEGAGNPKHRRKRREFAE